ncbi:ATP-binding protein [Actinomadura miaoliensis]|uniref:Schlafen AlbA-2 domain-containing protein n=1 Tax=Actinomadura miaoliensis TaxID=430685 RepID=A0ABP7W7F8_9ACTN
MAFSIDASSAFLLPSQLRRLAEAVRDAGPHDESRWVEWKSTLPLGTDQARVHLVKHILGFANRSPDVAARWAAGYGYLLIGVSPGKVPGVTSVDHNDMEQDLKPYIGPDLVWHAEYVELDGKDVLILVVDPPSYGDPIHYLRKPLPHPRGEGFVHSEHTVFIRRNAQTVKAEPGEWRMLLQRFATTQNRLDVELVSSQPQVERWADFPEHIELHLEQHRERLLNARHQDGKALSSVGRYLASQETRTWEEYAAEVDAHLEELKERFKERFFDEQLRHEPGGLSLTLVNRVDRPFRDVRVNVTVQTDGKLFSPGPVDEQLPEFRLPRPPLPYGAPMPPVVNVGEIHGGPFPIMPEGLQRMFCGWEVEELGDGLSIEFDAVDLRPRERLRLPHVPLLVTAEVGAELVVEWRAAGLSADGERGDRFAIPVASSTLKPLTGHDLGKWREPPADQDAPTAEE